MNVREMGETAGDKELTVVLVLEVLQALFQVRADGKGVFLKFFFFKDFEDREPAGGADGVPPKCVEVAPTGQDLCDLRCCNYGADGKPIPNALRKRMRMNIAD